MNQKELLDLQAKRGAKTLGSDTAIKDLALVTNECRKAIQDKSESYRELGPLEKKDAIKQIIIGYVMDTKPLVKGFTDNENRPDTNKLVDKLVEDITDYGILTAAMVDPDVYEIRGNGKEIKIEVKGIIQDLTDKDGNIISFSSIEQQDIILRKMLGDVRLTPKDAIVNSRTIEGYRIAAVHASATSTDPNDPNAEQYHAFVLRKFKKTRMKLPDLVIPFCSLSDNMARFLALLPRGGVTWASCGETGSGKTTLNNAILQEVPPNLRTILLQNPSEIDLRFRDPSGRVFNDVLHLEAKEKDDPTPADPTMSNLMDHTLRLSPSLVCFGELRSNREFKLGMQIMQAGHPINCTYHADSSVGAISRFLTAYLSESGNEPSHLALKSLTDLVDVIVIQKIFRDGTRKIIQISEVLGVDENDKDKPKLNDLYVFDINEEPLFDSVGNVVKINGIHKRVGTISERLLRKFQLNGIPKSRYDFLLEGPRPDEVEVYTGTHILDYGLANLRR